MSITQFTEEKNITNSLISGLSNLPETPTREIIEDKAKQLAGLFGYKGDLRNIITEAMESVVTRMGLGISLVDNNSEHDDQWVRKRNDIEWTYSKAYEKFLIDESWPPQMAQSLSDVTERILGLLQDPLSEGSSWSRRGLVIGHVQSGKTANYTGLIARAADAGYKFIVVIAGIHNNLRKQTQERIDEAFIGRSSDPKDKRKKIGVGLNKDYPHPARLTNVNSDFNKKTAESDWEINDFSKPIVLVIKKNVSTLTSLHKWLKELNTTGDGKIRDVPILLIDDEADNASINTNKEDLDPTKTNAMIRRILSLFAKSSYIGYTATPFANIFINPDAYAKEEQEELFPKDFIYCLEAPTTYFGAKKVFINDASSSQIVRPIGEDCEKLIPHAHKREFNLEELPPSLYKAFNQFIVARTIRNLRGQTNKHCSMMVNVSRFVPIQQAVRNFLSLYEKNMRAAVLANHAMPEDVSSQNKYMLGLKAAYDEEYSAAGFTWSEIKSALYSTFEHLHLYVINSNSDETLDFNRYSKEGIGLTAIAVGGLSLSRGLTIEGLTISYMYRNTKMYDTLMQMGRWFGYRPGYEDLCRIHLSHDSINWYSHIAEASEELVRQVKQMNRDKMSPVDFGLYVRSHPDALLITAANKMRTGQEILVEQNFSGRLIESYIVSTDPVINTKNFQLISDYWRNSFYCANDEEDGKVDTGKGLIFKGVPVDVIDRFLIEFECHESFTEQKLAALRYLEKISTTYSKADVLLISPKQGSGGNTPFTLKNQERSLGLGQPIGTAWKLNKHRVASRGDEKLGLSEPQLDKAKELATTANGVCELSDLHYRQARKRPLLMLHSLEPINQSNDKPEIGSVAAWGLSFPDGDKSKTVSVIANRIWLKLMQGHEDNPDEEEDYDV